MFDIPLLYYPVFILVYLAYKVVFPPLNFPRNIPTIPFYVNFLPILFGIDQLDVFRLYLAEPLERYGAVKIFFGSRWNILVSKPEYLSQLFKDENTFAKSGNQKKIPYSVLAAYTGDNVISAHGAIWRKYRNAVTNGLQHFDDAPIWENTKLFRKLLSKKIENGNSNRLSMVPLIQRLALDNISNVALGFDFGTLKSDNCPLHQHLLHIKKKIFHPFFLTFPFFDRLPIPSRVKGFKEVESFRRELVRKVQDDLITNFKFEQTTFASSDLIRAYNREELNYKQLCDNMIIILIAGHENPQMALTSMFYFLAKYPEFQELIREEVKGITESKYLLELPILNSFIYEVLRYYPPLNSIINRCTTRACRLGSEIAIPKGVYVGYSNYGSSHNTKNWGEDHMEFKPERWGKEIESIHNNWKYAKNSCKITSFHGGRRVCLGEKLALTEIRITITEMVKHYKWKLPNDWQDRVTPAGPLSPWALELIFEERN
ncbi:hypothetical protein TBLA_0A02480 [Henningerozyma blattae CBS 6284]|uniref:Dit2p n=1 Tax=Henningerozyma blattae (strain ATCC 34711 / CBS 6284 / DSM 70876 / NBRC 10599 / NRRL Y-10934 / UCD 77-7) TaxID=1071380 RepID=I2GV95_HENB6|nr:hypothetical protein TBLA_0A02480 [Tetrapisispora blattae CBS 6284]CCH58047.1 hypothetical protein TBLA_0A02480 [Tetrapisispora blattae CBS 6284]